MNADLGGCVPKIKSLQRAELDEQQLRIPDHEIKACLQTAVDLDNHLPVWLLEVKGISKQPPTPSANNQQINYPTKDILAGLNGQNIPIYFLLLGERQKVSIYIGTLLENEGNNTAIRGLFESQFPGGNLWPERELSEELPDGLRKTIEDQWRQADQNLRQIRGFLNQCTHVGVVTGMPTPNFNKEVTNQTQVDRLIRGLYGQDWAFLVMAEPVPDQFIVDYQLAILKEQLQLEQEQGLREWREQASSSLTTYYHQLLQLQHQLYENCLYEGAWQVQSFLCSPRKDTYQRGKALIKSVFSGDFARVDRIRVLDCPGSGIKAASFSPIIWQREATLNTELAIIQQKIPKYHTLVSSSQLSAAIHLPMEEMPGYFVRDVASFDVTSHVPPVAHTIAVGEILDRGRPTNNLYRIRTADLNKHCLVVGLTGSGKTNTMFYLLKQLADQEHNIPFLVIEPAKREYRRLIKLLGMESGLRVFTIGEESNHAAPFRINPFEVPPGVPVQTHIDLLKSVFNASFGMWAPLPQVLERAIIEVYQQKGWDAVQSTNERSGETLNTGRHPRSQPTLSDLFHKIGDLVPRLGYDAEVTRNVRTALETRINSLRMGAKGLMLDTHSSIPIQTLLDKPTVLELEGIGDDDEKAFVMGLLLISLYEYYRTRGEPADSDLRHVTVIEEAHRLLTNIPAQSGGEMGNPRAKAIETFVNMLSEVRAYGEGFLIAEQIPTKLAPDVIKNTAFKIMQRTVSTEDRTVMGGAMNLKEDQVRNVVSLGTGQAVVHGGGYYADDNAILVQVPGAKGDDSLMLSDQDIRNAWETFRDETGLETVFSTYSSCIQHCNPKNPNCSSARRVAELPRVAEAFTTLITTLVGIGLSGSKQDVASRAPKLLIRTIEAIQSCVSSSFSDARELRCIVSHGINRFLEQIGTQNGWLYPGIDQLASLLLSGIVENLASGRHDALDLEKINEFIANYLAGSERGFDPFYGCSQVCPNVNENGRLCLFRYPLAPYVNDAKVDSENTNADYDLGKLLDLAKMTTNRILDLDQADLVFLKASKCFLIQKVYNDSSLSTLAQKNLIDKLLTYARQTELAENMA